MSTKNSDYFRPPNQKGTTANVSEDLEAARNQLPAAKSKYVDWWESLTWQQQLFITLHPESTGRLVEAYYTQWHTMEGWPK